MRLSVSAVAVLGIGLALTACSESTSNEDLGLARAVEACNQELAGTEVVNSVAALAAEAAALDPRWRPLADYAGSLKSGADLIERLNEDDRSPSESELDLVTEVQADLSRFNAECEAVKALAAQE